MDKIPFYHGSQAGRNRAYPLLSTHNKCYFCIARACMYQGVRALRMEKRGENRPQGHLHHLQILNPQNKIKTGSCKIDLQTRRNKIIVLYFQSSMYEKPHLFKFLQQQKLGGSQKKKIQIKRVSHNFLLFPSLISRNVQKMYEKKGKRKT